MDLEFYLLYPIKILKSERLTRETHYNYHYCLKAGTVLQYSNSAKLANSVGPDQVDLDLHYWLILSLSLFRFVKILTSPATLLPKEL